MLLTHPWSQTIPGCKYCGWVEWARTSQGGDKYSDSIAGWETGNAKFCTNFPYLAWTPCPSLIDIWRHGGSTCSGVPAKCHHVRPHLTAQYRHITQVTRYGRGVTARCQHAVLSHNYRVVVVMAQHAVSNLDSSSTTMTNLSQHGVPGPCRYLLHDMSSTWRQGAAIRWPAWRDCTMPSYADVHDCILTVRHAGTKNFNGMLVYLGWCSLL